MEKSAGGIVVNDGKVVMVSEKGGYFGFPKGHIRWGESTIKGAKREIFEECGVDDLSLIHSFEPFKRKSGKLLFLFLFTTSQKNIKPMTESNPEAIWVDLDDVKPRLHHRADKDFFSRNIDKIKGLLDEVSED